MQIQKIGGYTNPYSTNKPKNTVSFKMRLDITATEAQDTIKKFAGKDGFRKILRIVEEWNKPENMLARFNKVAQDFGLLNFNPKKIRNYETIVVCPSFSNQTSFRTLLFDNIKGSPTDGFGKSSKPNHFDALNESLDQALNNYAEKQIFLHLDWLYR